MRTVLAATLAMMMAGFVGPVSAQVRTSAHAPVVAALAKGGLVIVMRHASSPRIPPTAETAHPDNPGLERQLDREGRDGAAAMGDALRRLRIPIGRVLSSPTYRARETVRAARVTPVGTIEALGDGGQSMQGITEAQAAWLRSKAAEQPVAGNTLIVTHQPNLTRAFPAWGGAVADGESVILRPDGRGGVEFLGRISIGDWARLEPPER